MREVGKAKEKAEKLCKNVKFCARKKKEKQSANHVVNRHVMIRHLANRVAFMVMAMVSSLMILKP